MNIRDIRSKYPEYNDLSDKDLADKFHDKFYSDIPKDDFYKKVGLTENQEKLIPDNTSGIFENLDPFAIGGEPGRKAAIESLAMVTPTARLAKFIPDAGKIAQALANYGGAIGQNAAIGAGANALEGNSATEGGEAGAIATAGLHPLISGLTNENPYLRLASGAGLGSLLGAGLGAATNTGNKYETSAGSILGGLAALKGRPGLEELALRNILKRLNPEEVHQAISNKSAAELVGTPINMLEAINKPVSGQQLAQLESTPASAEIMHQFGSERLPLEKKSIMDLLGKISPNDAYEKIEKPLYEKATAVNVDPKYLKDIFTDPYLSNVLKEVMSDPRASDLLQNKEPNSVFVLDLMKKKIDGEMENVDRYTRMLLNNKKQKLLDIADNASPLYETARDVSEKRQTREKIEDSINQAEMSGSNFYDKWLKNDDDFQKLSYNLRDRDNPDSITPEQQKLSAMRQILPLLVDPLTTKLSKTLASSNLNKSILPLDIFRKYLNNFLYGSYNKAMAQIITNPKWDENLKSALMKKNNNDKSNALANIFSRATSQGISAGVNNNGS